MPAVPETLSFVLDVFGWETSPPFFKGAKGFDFGAIGDFGLNENDGGFGAKSGEEGFNDGGRNAETGGDGGFGAVSGDGCGKTGACGERRGTRGVGRRTFEEVR